MAEKYEDILENYIARLLDIQDTPNEHFLDERDLQTVARDLGLNAQQLGHIEKFIQDHWQRGKQFLAHDLFDKAIEELRQAMALSPMNTALLNDLASAHRLRWEAQNDLKDKEACLRYAQRCIQINPSFQAAYDHIKSLEHSQPKQKNKHITPTTTSVPRKSPAPLIAIAAALVILLAVIIITFATSEPPPPTPKGNTNGTTSLTIEQTEMQIPVTLIENENTKGVNFTPQLSRLSPYEKSFSYKLQGAISSDKFEIIELRGRVDLLDKQGNILYTKYQDIQSEYNPTLRAGELSLFEILVYEEKQAPNLDAVNFYIDILRTTPAPQKYGVETPLPLTWGFQKPAHINLEIYPRNQRMSTFNNDAFITVAIKNTSETTLHALELRVECFDDQNVSLGSRTIHILVNSGPSLPSQQIITRPLLVKLSEGTSSFSQYAIQVIGAS